MSVKSVHRFATLLKRHGRQMAGGGGGGGGLIHVDLSRSKKRRKTREMTREESKKAVTYIFGLFCILYSHGRVRLSSSMNKQRVNMEKFFINTNLASYSQQLHLLKSLLPFGIKFVYNYGCCPFDQPSARLRII